MNFRQRITVALALVLALTAAGAARAADEPDYVVVQHLLIGFKKSVPGKDVTRSKRDARALAEELLAEAQAGAEFDALVKEHTDDSYPGIYGMTNKNAPRRAGARPRDGMAVRAPSFKQVID